MYAAVAVTVHEELLFDYGPLFKVASAGPADGLERGGLCCQPGRAASHQPGRAASRQPGRAANSKVVPVVDSGEEEGDAVTT